MASSTMIRSVQMQNIEPLPAEVIKCDLEAVCKKRGGGSDFGRLSKFVKSAIVNENWLA